jgi:hypothetical protein
MDLTLLVPLRYKNLASTANHILTISDPDAKSVSKNWPRRCVASHPKYKVRKEKPTEEARQKAMNVITTRQFYRELEEIIDQYLNRRTSGIWIRWGSVLVYAAVNGLLYLTIPMTRKAKGDFQT